MIIDQEYEESKGKRMIEILVKDEKVGVWMPIMAADVRIMNRDYELVKISEIRVRDFEKEKGEEQK